MSNRGRVLRNAGDFEQAAAEHLKAWGFTSVGVTGPGADGGIDVEGSDVVAQVKAYSAPPIGRPLIQQLVGAGLGKRCVFFSLCDYTPQAKEWAKVADVALFQFNSLGGDVEPVNEAASRLLRDRSTPREHPPEPRDLKELAQRALEDVAKIEPDGGYFILSITKAENRYVQGIAPRYDGTYIVESVGPKVAAPELESTDLDHLERLGWSPQDPTRNFQATINGERDTERAVHLLAETLQLLGARLPEDVTVVVSR